MHDKDIHLTLNVQLEDLKSTVCHKVTMTVQVERAPKSLISLFYLPGLTVGESMTELKSLISMSTIIFPIPPKSR